MNSEIVMFWDINRTELKKYAHLVIAGKAYIKVLIKDDISQLGGQIIAFPFNDKYKSGNTDLLKAFLSPVFRPRFGRDIVKRPTDWAFTVGGSENLYDFSQMTKFLEENESIVKPGFYEVFEGSDIANKILTTPDNHLSSFAFGAEVKSIILDGRRMVLYRSEIIDEKYRTAYHNGQYSPSVNECAFFLENAQRNEQPKRQPKTEVDFILNVFLDATNGTGGKPQLKRHMVNTVEAEFVPGEKWKWVDPTDNTHVKSEKRLLNRLSELRKQRKE